MTSPTTPSETLAYAIAHHQAGRLREAEQAYRQVLAVAPEDVNAWHLLGVASAQLGNQRVGIECIQRALALRPDWSDALFNLAGAFRELGQWDEAAAMLQRVVDIDPSNVQAYNNLGNVRCDQGRFTDAVGYYRQALSLRPDYAEAHNGLGIAFKNLGKLTDAETHYRQALQLRPGYADAHNNLGNVLKVLGQFEAAIACYRQAVQCQPAYVLAHKNLGLTFAEHDRSNEALACYRRALDLKPNDAETHSHLGNALKSTGDFAGAVACYARALELKPDYIDARKNLAIAWVEQDRSEDAKVCYRDLLRLYPAHSERPLWQLRLAGLVPQVFLSAEAIDTYRAELLRALETTGPVDLQQHLSSLPFSGLGLFDVIYHGRENRPLKEAYASIFRYTAPGRRPRSGRGSPRIGLLVTHGHETVFLRFWREILARMKGTLPIVICSSAGATQLRRGLSNDSVQLLVMSPQLDLAIETIRAAGLDVLYHWEVGTDSTNYFLPFFRLAPVQCTSLGVGETSGIGLIDHYLTSEFFESPSAQQYYTEKLILGKSLLTYQPRPAQLNAPKPREAFGLSPRQNVYLCAQNLRKFHPDFDPLLRGILEGDEAGVVVLVQDPQGFLAEKLRRRFAATIPEVADRVVMLPRLSYPDYLSLTAAADVLLDPLYYSGGTTSYDAFALGKPTVTWPSRLHIGRTTLACYRKMGIKGHVADSAEEYIQMAITLGTRPAARHAAAKEILAANGELFEDMQAVRDHEEFFERLVEEAAVRAGFE